MAWSNSREDELRRELRDVRRELEDLKRGLAAKHAAQAREIAALRTKSDTAFERVLRTFKRYAVEQKAAAERKWDGQPHDDRGRFDFGKMPGQQLISKPAFLGPAVQAARATVQSALALYAALSSRNSSGSAAVLAFNARAFQTQPVGDPEPETGRLTREQVDEVCPRHAEVQNITDRVASAIRREDYPTSQAYGTAVHTRIRSAINGDGIIPDDPNFRAEVSAIKTREARYGESGSTRIDVFENPGTDTVCVYDIKTGEKTGLSLARMVELAGAARTLYPDSNRIIVTEVRPKR